MIVEDYGDSVLVNWGLANPDAKLILIPYSENGCPGAPVELPVVINQRIVVNAALGEQKFVLIRRSHMSTPHPMP